MWPFGDLAADHLLARVDLYHALTWTQVSYVAEDHKGRIVGYILAKMQVVQSWMDLKRTSSGPPFRDVAQTELTEVVTLCYDDTGTRNQRMIHMGTSRQFLFCETTGGWASLKSSCKDLVSFVTTSLWSNLSGRSA